MIEEIRTRNGITRPVWIMPILESALGIENAAAIAAASEKVAALTIGLEDYTADLGVAKDRGRPRVAIRAFRLVNAAQAAGVQAIDSVFGDVGDMDGLRRWGESSRAMGFEGMGCIHPGQIRVIHDAFRPTASRLGRRTWRPPGMSPLRGFARRTCAPSGRRPLPVGRVGEVVEPDVVRVRAIAAQAVRLKWQQRCTGQVATDHRFGQRGGIAPRRRCVRRREAPEAAHILCLRRKTR